MTTQTTAAPCPLCGEWKTPAASVCSGCREAAKRGRSLQARIDRDLVLSAVDALRIACDQLIHAAVDGTDRDAAITSRIPEMGRLITLAGTALRDHRDGMAAREDFRRAGWAA